MAKIRNCRRKRGGRIPQWSTPLLPFYISAILHLPTSTNSQSLFRGVSFTELVEPYVAARKYDPNNPSETCFDKLYESDADGNGIVTNDEYSTFVAQLSEGDFNETNYIDLPFVIKVNFVYLSCLCRFLPENSDECCKGPDGGIYTSGTGPDEVPTEEVLAELGDLDDSEHSSGSGLGLGELREESMRAIMREDSKHIGNCDLEGDDNGHSGDNVS